MFEVAELGHKLTKEEYETRLPELRTGLLVAQHQLKSTDFPVIILISGVDGSGKGATINLLNEWMDPRYLRAYAFGDPSDEERERPEYWRFWRALPPRGRIGLYVGSWYSAPIASRVNGDSGDAQLEAALHRINAFEAALIDDGTLIIKFWLHLSRKGQRKRIAELENDPKSAWRVTRLDKKHLKKYDQFRAVAERTLRETSTGRAPWIIVDASDRRYRDITIGNHILERIRQRLDQNSDLPLPAPRYRPISDLEQHACKVNLLHHLDLERKLPKKTYKNELATWQGKLSELARHACQHKVSSIVLLEGWDAAGKGGLIRRIVPAMDARNYQIISIAAPSDEERAHHYLWRFWRHIPRGGHVTIYDRSWYGRVLVERVEGFAHEHEWMRAYTEINDFEEQLAAHGIVLLKLWLHIDRDEQLRRFREREKIPFKQYKITEEDYRNRDKWAAYEHAVNDMVERTSTEYAPWNLIEANDKRYARVKALKLYCERLELALERRTDQSDAPPLLRSGPGTSSG